MPTIVDKNRIDELLSRSVSTIYPSKNELKERLQSGDQLTFYMGIDPTADYVHLGHSTNYLVLERLHQLGHRIIVLVGDFTAMIGDPSDKTSMRVQLTREQVTENLKTFKQQIGKILNFDDKDNPIEFKFNSTWLADLTFQDSVELASNFTVQQMSERDSFVRRLKENKPLYLHEFFYPLMQGYDSVAMEVDGEIGGTDQTFNMLAGRTLLKRYKNKNKFVIATTLLENPVTGEKLMSKSLGTGVGLNENPKQMFIKIMQLPDEGVIQCFIDCTRVSMNEIVKLKNDLAKGGNPKNVKMRLAREIVTMYHGAKDAQQAEDHWVSQVSKKEENGDYPEVKIGAKADLIAVILKLGIVDSNSKIRRLFNEGAIRVDGVKLNFEDKIVFKGGEVLSIGKKHKYFVKK